VTFPPMRAKTDRTKILIYKKDGFSSKKCG